MKMRNLGRWFGALLLVVLFPLSLRAGNVALVVRDGLRELGLKKGDPRLGILTNAGYVSLRGGMTEALVDILQNETGASLGKGNLLFVHSSQRDPLKVALFRRDTGDCVFIKDDGKGLQKVFANLSPERATDPNKWGEIQGAFGRDAFAFASILGAWAKGAPHDLLKAAEFHNHLCPGVTSGYFIARFIQGRFPLGEGQSYRFIACPPWCKDDAIQVLLDLTPGKKGLYVMDLSEEQKEALPDPDVAGILVLWDEGKKAGRAVILEFNWEEAYRVSGVKPEEIRPKGGMGNPLFWTSRIKAALGLIPYSDQPERFVGILGEYEIDAQGLDRLCRAGSNPYDVVGYTKE